MRLRFSRRVTAGPGSVTSVGGSGNPGCGGRIFGGLFFSFFLGMGLLFTFLLLRDGWLRAETLSWDETPCAIEESGVFTDEGSEQPYEPRVAYAYEAEGSLYRSTRVRREVLAFSEYEKAQAIADRYPAGSRALCRVNPHRPDEAVLEGSSFLILCALPLPLVFVAIGAIGLWWTFRGGRARAEGAMAITAKAAKPGRATLVLVCFFGVFFVVGCLTFWLFGLRPAIKLAQARNWVEVPCTVESSRVQSHSDDDGTTYSIDILFAYEIDGRTYRSNRYGFLGGSSSGREGKEAVVRAHPPGTRTVCYVNPNDPYDAVLNRSFRMAYLVGLFPLIFLFAGFFGILWALRRNRKKREGVDEENRWYDLESLTLRPAAGPVMKFVGVLFLACFWNGIVSVFAWQAAEGWRKGHPDWFLTIFLVPFVLVGAGLVIAIFYQLLALANPRPRLTLTPGRPRLGQEVDLLWEFRGSAARIQALEITLEGREEATYTRGTDTRTDKHVFRSETVLSPVPGLDPTRGQRRFTVPKDAVPSFEAEHNKIAWLIRIHGDISRWPDVKEEFPIRVRPLRREEWP